MFLCYANAWMYPTEYPSADGSAMSDVPLKATTPLPVTLQAKWSIMWPYVYLRAQRPNEFTSNLRLSLDYTRLIDSTMHTYLLHSTNFRYEQKFLLPDNSFVSILKITKLYIFSHLETGPDPNRLLRICP